MKIMKLKNNIENAVIVILLIVAGFQAYLYIFRHNYVKIAIVYSEPYSKNEVEYIINIAKNDIENFFKEVEFKYKLDFYIMHYSLSRGLEEVLDILKREQIKFIIGFDFSYQIKKVFNIIENNDIILLNPYSSSDELCIKKDHIFRLRANDSYQGYVISKIIQYERKEAIIIANLNTTWSNKISKTIIECLKDNNIAVSHIIYNNVTYNTVNQIENSVDKFLKLYAPSKITIVNIGIFDTMDIVSKLNESSPAKNILWIGSDALVSKIILDDDQESVMKLFSAVPIICVSQAPSDSEQFIRVNNQYREIFGIDADIVQCARYDACWILANAIYQSRSTNVTKILQKIPQVYKTYKGLTGNCTFNNVNDRKSVNYSIYGYNENTDKLEIIGFYDSVKDAIFLYNVN